MSTVNGVHHHNVEDILASIRTSIADESGTRHIAGELHAPHQHQYAQQRPQRDNAQADESTDFELPAIFKPGHHTAVERPKLLGRLSEALKASNAAEAVQAVRSRTVIPFDPAANGRTIDPPQGLQMAANTAPPQYDMAASTVAQGGEVKREMPNFFDTRINKLGQWTRDAQAPKAPEPPPAAPQPQAQQFLRQPPTLPQGSFSQLPAEAVDDAAAQLLRPMLKQWLQENMPKIVEKALLSEVQGDRPMPGPTPGHMPGPRKPER